MARTCIEQYQPESQELASNFPDCQKSFGDVICIGISVRFLE